MHSVIVDDQPSACLILEQYALKNALIARCSSFHASTDAYAFLEDHPVDLLFLDIHLSDISGFELLERLKHKPMVIFTTFDKEYALDAFEHQAVDYLVKPIKYSRFEQAVKRAHLLLKNQDPVSEDDQLFIKVNQQLVRLSIPHILFVEAKGDYVNIHTDRGIYLVHSTLRYIEEKLPNSAFMKSHRSYLVNLHRITGVKDREVKIGEHAVTVSKANKDRLLERLNVL